MATAETTVRVGDFANEPFVDFSRPENQAAMEAALKKVAAEFGREYPDVHRRGEGFYYGEDDVDQSFASLAGDWGVSGGDGGACEPGGASGEQGV